MKYKVHVTITLKGARFHRRDSINILLADYQASPHLRKAETNLCLFSTTKADYVLHLQFKSPIRTNFSQW